MFFSSCSRTLTAPTTTQLNIPFHNPIEEEETLVEIIDPTHPLFGRTFPLISFSSQPDAQYILVRYQEYMALRIPLLATNLISAQPKVPTRLTFTAIQELISAAEAGEILCPPNLATCGDNSLLPCESKSWPNSRPSSRK